MNWHAIIGITGGLIQVISVVPYIRDMIKGRTRPNIISWSIWLFLNLIAVFAQFASGASWSILILIVIIFNISLVLFLAVRGFGYRKYGKVDFVCLAMAFLAIILWQVSDKPELAIAMSILADFFALVPTVVKVFHEPFSEYLPAWIMNVSAAVFAGFSTNIINFSNLAFPIYYFITDVLVVGLIYFRQKKMKKSLT